MANKTKRASSDTVVCVFILFALLVGFVIWLINFDQGSSTAPVSQTTPTIQTQPNTHNSNCNPNYGGCVPNASDIDSAGGSGDGPLYVSGPVIVKGTDVYGLDRDGNGVGCE